MMMIVQALIEVLCTLILTPLFFVLSVVATIAWKVIDMIRGNANKSFKPIANEKYAIVVTGASSGIGRALVFEYARVYTQLNVALRFGLMGTNAERLQQVATELQEKYGIKPMYIEQRCVDVRDENTMRNAIDHFESTFNGINLLIANAGVSEYVLKSSNPDIEFEELQRGVFNINFVGVMNTVLPIISRIVKNKKYLEDQKLNICIISSTAGETPFLSMYTAAKKALTEYSRFLRMKLRDVPAVNLSVACPGWVDTNMSDKYPRSKFGMVQSDVAAKTIIDGLERGQSIIAFPYYAYALLRVLGTLPNSVLEPILRALPVE
jgi:short-subunit dehydrogenase